MLRLSLLLLLLLLLLFLLLFVGSLITDGSSSTLLAVCSWLSIPGHLVLQGGMQLLLMPNVT
jgi:hypothetical protein